MLMDMYLVIGFHGSVFGDWVSWLLDPSIFIGQVADENNNIVFSSATSADEISCLYFRRSGWPTKIAQIISSATGR
jgi:hypothetical protein